MMQKVDLMGEVMGQADYLYLELIYIAGEELGVEEAPILDLTK